MNLLATKVLPFDLMTEVDFIPTKQFLVFTSSQTPSFSFNRRLSHFYYWNFNKAAI